MSAKKSGFRGDLRGLKNLSESLYALRSKYHVRVGVFGDKNVRDDGLTNAEVGAVHEFGSVERKIPQRSFLRTPLIMKAQAAVSKEIKEKDLKALTKYDVVGYLKRVGKIAEGVVDQAFQTGCWGQWPQLAYSTLLSKLRGSLQRRRQMAAEQIHEGKQHSAILVQSAQLRHSITSKVVGR